MIQRRPCGVKIHRLLATLKKSWPAVVFLMETRINDAYFS